MSGPSRRLRGTRRGAPWLAVAVGVPLVGALLIGSGIVGGKPSPSPSATGTIGIAASPTPAGTTPSPTDTATPGPTPSPTPGPVAATTNGIWLAPALASLATRHPIAVMIDDQFNARPQSGLAAANIVYQAPAEGGIPRYMAIFQTGDPPSVGPVRSSRLYFVAWAAEWRAIYVHVGGAPNALAFLSQVTGRLVYDADEFRWGGKAGYLWRIATRASPHNVYSSGKRLDDLAARLGATSAYVTASWTFKDDVDPEFRVSGGSIVVPYLANQIVYAYDAATNRYRRSVTGEKPQRDAGSGQPIAPANVIVLKMAIGALVNTNPGSTNEKKHRLEVRYTGSGDALVFNDGQLIRARWSKASDGAPTLLTYAAGPSKGMPVPLVRGQIFVQVVSTTTSVSWKLGTWHRPALGPERV